MTSPARDSVVILIPLHNDWDAFGLLLPRLDTAVASLGRAARVLVIDDGSDEPAPETLRNLEISCLERVDVLPLRRNLGHQRAIALGLCYVHDHLPSHDVVVMDGDGEDDPADVPRLIARLDLASSKACVFAERKRRAESWWFRVCYALYRLIHLLLTGVPVRIGNFSALPAAMVRRLVVVSDLWNHYAASAVKARLPIERVPCRRQARLSGRSRMNFVGLVSHGLSAISVFSDRVGVRLLIASVILTCVLLFSLAGAVVIKLATTLAIPGWATSAVGLLCILLTQLVMLSLVFVFMILSGREGSSFLPARDYVYFVEEVTPLCRKATDIREKSSTSSREPETGKAMFARE